MLQSDSGSSEEVSVQSRILGLAFVAALVLAPPAGAHHSHGNYQMTEYTYLTGTVMEMHLINPHSWIYVEVTGADGKSAMWALEAASVGTLTRSGLTEGIIKVGDTVSVRCHQLRDGSSGCLLGFLTPQGGVEQEWD